MQRNLNVSVSLDIEAAGHLTSREIARQPELWSVVAKEVRSTAERIQLGRKIAKQEGVGNGRKEFGVRR
jgi:hypothetical protein